jgi:hypothetical protein
MGLLRCDQWQRGLRATLSPADLLDVDGMDRVEPPHVMSPLR